MILKPMKRKNRVQNRSQRTSNRKKKGGARRQLGFRGRDSTKCFSLWNRTGPVHGYYRVSSSGGPDLPGQLHDRATENVTTTEQMIRLMEKVKDLVVQGRRLEAHKLVRKLDQRGSKGKLLLDHPEFFARNVLDTLIDISVNHSIESFTNSLGMKMVRIPAGGFVMGSSEADIAWAMATLAQGQPVNLENEFPFHKVRISRPFFMCATEVTVGWFRKFVEETGYITDAEDEKGGQVFNAERAIQPKPGSSWKNPGWTISDDQPVVMVSYNDAQAFCEWLTAKEKLPTSSPQKPSGNMRPRRPADGAISLG